ncbi:MAG: 2-dehydro-3-deoxyglucarate aldolase, partial [Armatimonadetes bacterium]|nr:2-dehydro-3-deoxyglucarate aldolase [Armatimonadota bacterium]
MKKNIVKARLKAGKASVGTWLSLCSNIAAEYMAQLGWEWLVVDTEHSPIGFEKTIACFQAICTTNTIPLARVAWNEPVLIKRLLDGGALGLVIPMVNTEEEARRAVAAMKFPPEGIRSIGGGRCTVYGDDYFDTINNEMVVIVQAEHIQAVENIEAILSVEGVDGCFIGPNDLAGSMGIRYGRGGQHPEFEAAIQKVLAAA